MGEDEKLREALQQIRDLSSDYYDSDRAWALAMQLRAKVALRGCSETIGKPLYKLDYTD